MLPKPCIALLKCKRNFEKKKTVATNFNFWKDLCLLSLSFALMKYCIQDDENNIGHTYLT